MASFRASLWTSDDVKGNPRTNLLLCALPGERSGRACKDCFLATICVSSKVPHTFRQLHLHFCSKVSSCRKCVQCHKLVGAFGKAPSEFVRAPGRHLNLRVGAQELEEADRRVAQGHSEAGTRVPLLSAT